VIRRSARIALAFVMFSAAFWFAGAQARAATGIVPLRVAALHAAAGLRAMYGSVNAADLDAYIARALFDPARPVGASEPCLRTDNSVSTMPSPLGAVRFPEPSIAQRGLLVESIAAYAQAVSALAADAPSAEVAANLGDLGEAIGRLNASANEHLARDLAIARPVAVLAAGASELSAEHPRGAALSRSLLAAKPTLDALLDILAKDVSASHAEALTASADAYSAWLADDDLVRNLAVAGVGRKTPAPALVRRCAAPPGSQTPPGQAAAPARTAVARDAQAEAATLGIRLAVLTRVSAAQKRRLAIASGDPSNAIAALRTVIGALPGFVQAPGDAKTAAELQTAIAAFRSGAESAYDAYAGAASLRAL
jgi:hypothetical protein